MSFQCVVDHERKVQMCITAFCGATNDKLIFKTVAETLQIINGKLEDVTFTLYDANGQLVYCKGGYLIIDCGYLQIACLMDSTKLSWNINDVRWAEFLELVHS